MKSTQNRATQQVSSNSILKHLQGDTVQNSDPFRYFTILITTP
uniref:Uncharacterized protein n=1 Tax=Anguilla anguilla TaxID=7936 RepID=A0A0E9RC17_ANGAN